MTEPSDNDKPPTLDYQVQDTGHKHRPWYHGGLAFTCLHLLLLAVVNWHGLPSVVLHFIAGPLSLIGPLLPSDPPSFLGLALILANSAIYGFAAAYLVHLARKWASI